MSFTAHAAQSLSRSYGSEYPEGGYISATYSYHRGTTHEESILTREISIRTAGDWRDRQRRLLEWEQSMQNSKEKGIAAVIKACVWLLSAYGEKEVDKLLDCNAATVVPLARPKIGYTISFDNAAGEKVADFDVEQDEQNAATSIVKLDLRQTKVEGGYAPLANNGTAATHTDVPQLKHHLLAQDFGNGQELERKVKLTWFRVK